MSRRGRQTRALVRTAIRPSGAAPTRADADAVREFVAGTRYALALGSGRLVTCADPDGGPARVLAGTEPELRAHCAPQVGRDGVFMLGTTLAPVPEDVPTVSPADWSRGRG